MSDDADDLFSPEPEVWCRHLLLCRSVWFDHRQPERGFSLGGVYVHVIPEDGSFPYTVRRLCVYVQLCGTVGEYTARIRFVRVGGREYDEEEEEQLGDDGEPREFDLPTARPLFISGLSYAEEFAFPIDTVPFPERGTYEFQLWLDGFDEPVGRERIEAREG